MVKLTEAARAREMQLGGGGRFTKLKGQLAKEGAESPGALAAWIGRRKYGAARFAQLAVKGRKRG